MLKKIIFFILFLSLSHASEATMDEEKLNDALNILCQYAEGKLSPDQLMKNTAENYYIDELRQAQDAHFIFELSAEIDRDRISEPSKNLVIEKLSKVDNFFEGKKSTVASEKFKNEAVENIFKGIASNTEVQRTVLKGTHQYWDCVNKKIIDKIFNLVVFMINPDGFCGDYAIGNWDRNETINNINNDSKLKNDNDYKKYLNKNNKSWLCSGLVRKIILNKNKKVYEWMYSNGGQLLCDLFDSEDEEEVHVFSLVKGVHYTSFVNINNIENMIPRKIHENRFNMKMKNYQTYIEKWVK